jgi:serine/threonine-protein kinase
MGVVYRGRHKVIDKRVAIKILRGDMAADAEMVERFLNEARAASSIGNPHIVDISDFGRLDDGATYFVMEYLDGQSLAGLQANTGVIPIPRLVHIAKQIARGLSAAHARGIVHRDLKPDNVMLIVRGEDRDFAKVLDFGIAKVNSEAGRLTRAGSVFGTPHYMSPEQAAGVPVDQRTDIYSLGVILYEMASGKVPFDADNFMGILTQHMYKSPAPIRALIPQPQEVPPGLEAIVLKCLSKKVELRYQSMDEVIADLERVERGMVPEAVQEMMGRSGGFNVPADYFRKAQHPAGAGMMPATPSFRQKKPVLAMVIASVAAVSFLIIAGLVAYPLLAASKVSGGATGGVASADPSAAGLGLGAAAAPELKQPLFVSVEPPDAMVGLEDGALQTGSLTLNLAPTESVNVRFEKKGYVSQVVTIEGREIDPRSPFKRVMLVKEKPVAAVPTGKVPAGKPTNGKPLPAAVPPTSAAPKTLTCPPGMKLDMFGKGCERPLDPDLKK